MTESTAVLKSATMPYQMAQLDRVVIGKDVLELVSSAMYVEPLTIFREYVQNSADAIDEAHAAKLYSKGETGQVSIEIDAAKRKVTIRDNGVGVPWTDLADG